LKLHFDPNQQFQLDAINSIVGIFEGQPLNQSDFSFFVSSESYERIGQTNGSIYQPGGQECKNKKYPL